MKKLVCLLLSLLMLAACIPAMAEGADSGRILAVDAALMGLANMSPQVKGGESTDRGCIGLQSAPEGDGFADGYIMFPVEVNTAGLYEITVRYAAKAKAGQTRCADLIVNDGERIHLPITGQADWNVYVPAKVSAYLNAGSNVLTLKNVEGFDNSVYKAINVDYLQWDLVMPAADEGRILAVEAQYENLNDMSAQFKGGESSDKGVLGLQPAKDETGAFKDGHITFLVPVETAGTYELTVRYAAKAKAGQTRCADVIINDGERVNLPIVGQADWDVYVPAKVIVELEAGLNVIKLTNVEGYDNSTWKSINVDYLQWTLVPATDEVPTDSEADAQASAFLSRMHAECSAAIDAVNSLDRSGGSKTANVLGQIRSHVHAIGVLSEVQRTVAETQHDLVSPDVITGLYEIIDSCYRHLETGAAPFADYARLSEALAQLQTMLDALD